MTIYYKAENRKPLVQAVSEFTGAAAVYMRTPTYAYRIDYFTVTREGNLEFDNMADSEEIEKLIEFLADKGFVAEEMPTESADDEEGEVTAESETEPQEASVGLTVEIPLNRVQVGNLTKLLDAKGSLIKKALGVADLRFEIKDDRISFPWFGEVDADSAKAYTHFIAALCSMAKEAKRVTATEKAVDNEKYAFRCFLLRLGFIGTEYKAERKILLKNLTGSSAFKNGGAGDAVSE